MRKKLLLFVLSVAVAAMAALPTAASATPWHTEQTGSFTVHSGVVVWSTASAITLQCNAATGSGSYSTTTGGTVTLQMGTCWTNFGFGAVHCTTAGQANGFITTTTLGLDNVMLGTNKPGILLTPNAETGIVASFSCGALPFTVEGNGLLATVTAPACGASSSTATWKFRTTSHGMPEHTLYTGTIYNWKRGAESIALSMDATVTFPAARKPTCT